jgi:prevent-host-death family protein
MLWEANMLKTITTSDLRTHVKRVLNEVGYGGVQYLVEKFGEPTAAIISVEDYQLLQATKRQQATDSLRDTLTSLRARNRAIEAGELDALVEEARSEFYRLQSDRCNAQQGANAP